MPSWADDAPDQEESLEVCTGCGNEAFACIVGNGDIRDYFHGPYALCEEAYREWLDVGETIVLIHD